MYIYIYVQTYVCIDGCVFLFIFVSLENMCGMPADWPADWRVDVIGGGRMRLSHMGDVWVIWATCTSTGASTWVIDAHMTMSHVSHMGDMCEAYATYGHHMCGAYYTYDGRCVRHITHIYDAHPPMGTCISHGRMHEDMHITHGRRICILHMGGCTYIRRTSAYPPPMHILLCISSAHV